MANKSSALADADTAAIVCCGENRSPPHGHRLGPGLSLVG
jgi:hypothetical protein